MELGLRTIAIIIMVLVVLLVVSMFFTRGSDVIYGRAQKFEEGATKKSDVAGGLFSNILRSAWHGCPSVSYPPSQAKCVEDCSGEKVRYTEEGDTNPTEKACQCVAVVPNKWVRIDGTGAKVACVGAPQKLYEEKENCEGQIPEGCTCQKVHECTVK